MGLFKKTTCPKCGQAYSVLKAECPYCGARQQKPSGRTPRTSDAVRKGTAAHTREEDNTRWQLIFGLCLLASVVIAVIILITTTLSGNYQTVQAEISPSVTVTPSLSPTPTATPEPTPTVESITITFLGQPIDNQEFSTKVGNTTQLDAVVYPLEIQEPVEWSVDDESKIKIDENGLVTAVSAGWATVIARCYGQAAECKVLVQ